MKFGIFGTGLVGQTIGSKLVACGHEVKLGSRTATNEQGKAWADTAGIRASHGSFADAARSVKYCSTAPRATPHSKCWRAPEPRTSGTSC